MRDHDQSAETTAICAAPASTRTFAHGQHKVTRAHHFRPESDIPLTRETVGRRKIGCFVSVLRVAMRSRFCNSRGTSWRRAASRRSSRWFSARRIRCGSNITGTQTIKVGDQKVDADRMVATIKGPVQRRERRSIFFARRCRANAGAGESFAAGARHVTVEAGSTSAFDKDADRVFFSPAAHQERHRRLFRRACWSICASSRKWKHFRAKSAKFDAVAVRRRGLSARQQPASQVSRMKPRWSIPAWW